MPDPAVPSTSQVDDGGWGEFVPKAAAPVAAPSDGGWGEFLAPVMPKDPRAQSGFQNFAGLTGMRPQSQAQTVANARPAPTAGFSFAGGGGPNKGGNPFQSRLPNVFATQRAAAPEKDALDNPEKVAGVAESLGNIPSALVSAFSSHALRGTL